ncbi:DUF6327 family protein [Flavobacterium sp.]|uniref:DUF6327 family protein n=1 Tax=Flavobacterium sp. TaxID=239 RepID=UPI00286A6D56|nr:DUF6327 family protein [Flavobacterium sp.]
MEIKKYSSYAQIETELEILKLEKELNYQKLVSSVQKTKDSLTLQNMVGGFLGSYKSVLSNSYVTILKTVLPYIISWIINKKRGK